MSVTDLIADQLTVIRNAIMAGKRTAILKRSGILEGIMKLAKKEGFIDGYAVLEDNKQNMLKVYIKYDENEEPVMSQLEKISTPGRRKYVSCEDIPEIMGGVGFCIVSTNKGLLSGEEAKKMGVGGELICKMF